MENHLAYIVFAAAFAVVWIILISVGESKKSWADRPAKLCGAITNKGTPCRNPAAGIRVRCRFHGDLPAQSDAVSRTRLTRVRPWIIIGRLSWAGLAVTIAFAVFYVWIQYF